MIDRERSALFTPHASETPVALRAQRAAALTAEIQRLKSLLSVAESAPKPCKPGTLPAV